MRKSVILTVNLLLCCLVTGQERAIHKNMAPSPEAAAFAQYADMPISMYTGTPTINIPLYTIRSGSYSFPISLSYHASGIKVAQEASWVGLGWCLNAGGVISRTICGKDDLKTYGYFMNTEAIPNPDNLENEYFRWEMSSATDHTFALRLNKDAEPDVFFYNFLGYSGKFYCKLGGAHMPSGEGFICSNPEDNLKIELFTGHGIFDGFKVTTPDGAQYFFEHPEIKKSFSISKENPAMDDLYGPLGNHTPIESSDYHEEQTSWYLSMVKYPNGDIVSLEYVEEDNNSLSPISVLQNQYKVIQRVGKNPWNIAPNAVYSMDLVVYTMRLQRIVWKSGNIVFGSSERKDIRPLENCNCASYAKSKPQKLDFLSIREKGTNALLKTYKFHTSYFRVPDKEENYLNLRLKLDSISITGTSQKTYKYRMQYDLSHPLPSKNSFSCDIWGYYNGRDNNCFHPAFTTEYNYANSDHNVVIEKGHFFPGANREVYPEFLTSSMLTSIEDPQGALTEYKYEAKDVAGPEVHRLLSENGVLVKKETFVKPSNKNTTVYEFYMLEDGFIKYLFHFNGSDYYNPKEEGTAILYIYGHYYTVNDLDKDMNIRGKIALTKGRYTLDMQTNTCIASSINIEIYKSDSYVGPPLAGGVRIAEIKSPVSTKKFTYKYDGGKSSGLLIRKPLFAWMQEYTYYKPIDFKGDDRRVLCGTISALNYTSRSLSSLESPSAGTSVGYGRVSVITTSEKGDLREDYYYHNAEERQAHRLGFPGEFIFTNGKLKRHCVLKDRENIRLTSYFYDTHEILRLDALREDLYYSTPVETYSIPIAHCRIRSKGDSIIESGIPNKLVYNTFINYTYNNTNYQVNGIVDMRLQCTKKHKILFSSDLKGQSPYKEMCENNVCCVPIEESYLTNDVLTKKQLHTYKQRENSNQFVPEADYVYFHPEDAAEPQEFSGDRTHYGRPEVTYAGYDTSGNCTSMLSRMNQSTVYIWGYNHQYLIAQIFNATENEIRAQGIDIDKIGNENEPTATQWKALHSLRSKLPEAEVTIMTYQPLIGITSKTDSRGLVTHYEYDDMGRLNCIRDHENNIVETYDYKLATEQ